MFRWSEEQSKYSYDPADKKAEYPPANIRVVLRYIIYSSPSTNNKLVSLDFKDGCTFLNRCRRYRYFNLWLHMLQCAVSILSTR